MLERRNLTKKEALAISEATKNNLHLGFYSADEWIKQDCFVLSYNNEIVGACAYESLPNWTKLGPLIITKNYQRKGYGSELIKYAAAELKGNIYLRSSNPAIAKIATNLGFKKENNYLRLPLEIKREHLDAMLNHLYLLPKFLKEINKRGKFYYFIKQI